MFRRVLSSLVCLVLLVATGLAQPTGNLLRNGRLQDDWLTLLPENKNHHWCYSSEFYNRRDFNPDGWTCKGAWQWTNPDAASIERRLVLQGPFAELTQDVHWAAVHDDRQKEGFPDAGGFPKLQPQRSLKPLRVVRDLTLRVRVRGKDVPAKTAGIAVAWPTTAVAVAWPEGTYEAKWVEVKLPAADWLKSVKDANAKDGPVLPDFATVSLRYQAKAGQVEVEQAELVAGAPDSPNLLPHGGFQKLDADGYPVGWSRQLKYRYFPPGHYYIFNTWHNANSPNRGPVGPDSLIHHDRKPSLKMIVASGDEKCVVSDPITLNQKESRLLEVSAWVKTDQLCMMQIDAVNENGERLDCFDFIHKAPVSVGTDDWRLVRQLFRPRAPVKSVRLQLAARGVNGYTLDDTGVQPQNNVTGTIWWDDVQLFEPESTAAELKARGVEPAPDLPLALIGPHLENLDLGERMLGDNVLSATINRGMAGYLLRFEFTSPSGKASTFEGKAQKTRDTVTVRVPYTLTESCPTAYTEYRGTLTLIDDNGTSIGSTPVWFGAWTTPVDLELGGLFLPPDQKQLVRMNLGFSAATMAKVATVRLEVVRRGTGEVLKKQDVPATPAAITAQREKLPAELREDFRNLLLADLDVSMLPVQPFHDPQRNWLIRAVVLDAGGKEMGRAESQPFCRQAHEPAQPAITSVRIKGDLLYVNDKPWMPWGVCYGHVPVYSGPADAGAGKYRDLHTSAAWGIYDRFGYDSISRKRMDFNCLRHVAGSIGMPATLEKSWKEDNLYASTTFVVPNPAFSIADLAKGAGDKAKLDAYLDWCKKAPMVVSVTPGLEEVFGLFHGATPEQLKGMGEVVDYLRKQTGKPVMVGHGGYWNRFEFELAPWFDIYDPETEPFYPAHLHTDLRPLVTGKDKVIWLRPQMYEDVPIERWRFHVYVEMMRGARGWQTAHGPGDATIFRGLHGEMEHMKPILSSQDAGPKVETEPAIEHWSKKHNGKVYVVAGTTHGVGLGAWKWAEAKGREGKVRVTESGHEYRDEANAYGLAEKAPAGPAVHGIQHLPDAKPWGKGAKLVQWVRLDEKESPTNLAILIKGDGRWTHVAAWGKADAAKLRTPEAAYWFLLTFHRHAKGFLGWGKDLVAKAMGYIPERFVDMGDLPAKGKWVKLEVPLEKLGVTGKLIDGVAFMHEGGRVEWGHTTIVEDGNEALIWGDAMGAPAEKLAKTKVTVPGLKAGTKVRVLWEDRELTAGDGHFVDDFRGQDLYQRFGGGDATGYGDTPVALHVYEIP